MTGLVEMTSVVKAPFRDMLCFNDAEKYKSAAPFPHIVIDDFLKPEFAEALFDAFPDVSAPFWYEYSSPLERKLACNVRESFPKPVRDILDFFNSDSCTSLMGQLAEIQGLKADPGLHGGGMHCTKSGGKLDIHLDYRLHPHLGLERRLNLIYFLNKNWDPTWGGELELWNKDMSECVVRVAPIFNRAVLFNTDDLSYHGHPEPLQCPEGVSRKSLAVYYLTEPRLNATDRFRAQYVARPQDPKDPAIEELRRLRAGNATSASVYRV